MSQGLPFQLPPQADGVHGCISEGMGSFLPGSILTGYMEETGSTQQLAGIGDGNNCNPTPPVRTERQSSVIPYRQHDSGSVLEETGRHKVVVTPQANGKDPTPGVSVTDFNNTSPHHGLSQRAVRFSVQIGTSNTIRMGSLLPDVPLDSSSLTSWSSASGYIHQQRNYRLSRYMSPCSNDEAEDVDALEAPWPDETLYAFPPVCILKKVLQHPKVKTRFRIILVVPWSTHASWMPLLPSPTV